MKINPAMQFAATLLFVTCVIVGPAFAQAAAAASDSVVAIAPWYDALSALLVGLAAVVVSVVFAIAAFYLNKWFGIKLNDNLRQTLHSAAVTGIAAALAGFRGRFEDQTVDVKNATLAQALEWMRVKGAPAAIEKFNLTEKDLTELVMSKIPAIEGGVAPSPTPEAPPAVQG